MKAPSKTIHTTYKKLHKWPGLIVSFLLLYYSITGIIMNHRETFSSLDVSRAYLPSEFEYRNWNNGALKGSLTIGRDSILVYGSIGIWVTDSTYQNYRSLNRGFANGSDNQKIFDMDRDPDGNLYAATQFGLYGYDQAGEQWLAIGMDGANERVVGIEHVLDTIYVMNRSHLFKGKAKGKATQLERVELGMPDHHEKKVSLFSTIWQIHSGEIFGIPGKLFVDGLGVVTIILSITGIVYFLFPGWIRRRKQRQQSAASLVAINRWSIKWHNKGGAWFFGFLVVLFLSGMFLRPPLLIGIAYVEVPPIKFTNLDQPNPWHDQLRDFKYDAERDRFVVASADGLFQMDKDGDSPEFFGVQPPVSVMGINVLEPFRDGAYLVGSFSGLFLWHPSHPEIYNYAEGKLHEGVGRGRPVGDYKVTGLLTAPDGKRYLVEYDKGVVPLHHEDEFPQMPDHIVSASKMSLWNLSLEIHTGRFFRFLLGDFFILLVPLTGLVSIVVVLSGYLLWRKRFRKPKGC